MMYRVLMICAFCAGLAFIVFTDPRAQSMRDGVSKTTGVALQ
jgi:hypothetical protein